MDVKSHTQSKFVWCKGGLFGFSLFYYALLGLNRFKMIINGIEYIERPVAKSNTKMSGYIAMMLAMYMGNRLPKAKSLPTHNIIAEFERIQNKQSMLSRSEREQVVREFNKHFIPKP